MEALTAPLFANNNFYDAWEAPFSLNPWRSTQLWRPAVSSGGPTEPTILSRLETFASVRWINDQITYVYDYRIAPSQYEYLYNALKLAWREPAGHICAYTHGYFLFIPETSLLTSYYSVVSNMA